MNDVQQFDESWEALGDSGIHRTIEQKRAGMQETVEPAALILVARVTVGDETLIVRAGDVTAALTALHGEPKAGMRLEATMEFDAMTPAEFSLIPEYQ
jgi:hypothetical protein